VSNGLSVMRKVTGHRASYDEPRMSCACSLSDMHLHPAESAMAAFPEQNESYQEKDA